MRSEPGIYYEDLYPLLSFLPQGILTGDSGSGGRYDRGTTRSAPPASSPRKTSKQKQSTFDPEIVLPDLQADMPLQAARTPPQKRLSDRIFFLVLFRPVGRLFGRIFGKLQARNEDREDARGLLGKRKALRPIESNIPFESE